MVQLVLPTQFALKCSMNLNLSKLDSQYCVSRLGLQVLKLLASEGNNSMCSKVAIVPVLQAALKLSPNRLLELQLTEEYPKFPNENISRKKMQLSDKNTTPDLIEAFHPSQLEQKYGGTAKNVTSNYWPPIMPSSDYGPDEDDLMSEGKYEELMNKNTQNQENSLGKY